MKKEYGVFMGLVLLAGAALFWRQIWNVFAGMTVLEAIKQIVTYFLHVAVATAVMTVAIGLPKIFNAWSGLLRMKRRAARRAYRHGQPVEARTSLPRMNNNQALAWMVNQLAKSSPSQRPPQTKSAFGERAKDEINLRF